MAAEATRDSGGRGSGPPDVFHAIADPKRRRILDLLLGGELPVHTLVDEFDVSFAAISQHLRVLREAGLVTRRIEGREHLYGARPEALVEVHEWTARHREFWQGGLDRLGKHLDGQ
jgi:DNA-binding transcriptional ArsR family regulator